jgi:hypothetical protein
MSEANARRVRVELMDKRGGNPAALTSPNPLPVGEGLIGISNRMLLCFKGVRTRGLQPAFRISQRNTPSENRTRAEARDYVLGLVSCKRRRNR